MPCRRKWQPTPVFLPGESLGQRSLASYGPWSHKEVGHDLAAKQQQEQKVSTLLGVASPGHTHILPL